MTYLHRRMELEESVCFWFSGAVRQWLICARDQPELLFVVDVDVVSDVVQ